MGRPAAENTHSSGEQCPRPARLPAHASHSGRLRSRDQDLRWLHAVSPNTADRHDNDAGYVETRHSSLRLIQLWREGTNAGTEDDRRDSAESWVGLNEETQR